MRTFTSDEMCDWLDAVGDLAAAVTTGTPLPDLLQLIARTACELTGYEASAVLLPDKSRGHLIILGSFGLSTDYVAGVNKRNTITLTASGPLSKGPSTTAFLQARPTMVSDILADPTFAPWAHLAHDYGYRALASLPLLVDGVPAGTLNCYRTRVHDFVAEEVALLRTLASQAGIALQSSRLITSLTEERRLSEQSEAIHRGFTEVALRAEGVQGVADALARLLGRPVLVTDTDGLVLANAAVEGVQLAPESLPLASSDVPVDGLVEIEGTNRLTAPVSLGREPVARLWLSGQRSDLDELDIRAIEHATMVCALEFLRQRTAVDVEWSLRSDLLADLLAGMAPDALAARASALGHDLKAAHTVVVATADQPGPPTADRSLLGAVRAVAAQQEPRPLVTTIDRDVVVLWPLRTDRDPPRAAAEQIRRSMSRTSPGASASVVVGHRCDRIDEARGAVGAARGALELARLRGSDRVVSLPELGVYGLLLQLNDPRELVRFAEHTLAPLREHDARKSAQLLRTARTYLDNGMSVARTAKVLYVHQNTVGLRLKKIEELTGVSVQEPEAWLQLKVALMAEDVLGETTSSA